ncbi:MAG: Qat anti-phage system TatD family nuclease QatD [Acidobacteriota bacterium]
MYVDAHCHVDLYEDYEDVLAEAERERVYTVAVTNTPSVFWKMEALTQGSRYVRAALGLHPELAVERQGELVTFESLLPRTRYVGEVGLDFKRAPEASRDIQRQVFETILGVCAAGPARFITMHSRGAEKEVIDAIRATGVRVPVLHWYSGSLQNLDRALDAGCFFSVNLSMCSTASGRRIIARVPLDRLLTETDGPFSQVEGRPSRPRDLKDLADRVANIVGSSADTIRAAVMENFTTILREVPTTG